SALTRTSFTALLSYNFPGHRPVPCHERHLENLRLLPNEGAQRTLLVRPVGLTTKEALKVGDSRTYEESSLFLAFNTLLQGDLRKAGEYANVPIRTSSALL